MIEDLITWALTALAVYLALGAVFLLPFQLLGLRRIDPSANGGSWGFRVLISPGVVALWPWMLRRWIAGRLPEERSAHIAAARGRAS